MKRAKWIGKTDTLTIQLPEDKILIWERIIPDIETPNYFDDEDEEEEEESEENLYCFETNT